MANSLENVIFRCIERFMAGRFSERHGLVTSYDPEKYLAKVKFQPDGLESGWLPIETGHIGQGYGIAVGLEVGDGKETGDQVIIRYQENDFEGGKIVQRVHSDKDKPPRVESGEMVMWTKWGQQMRFNKDGSVHIKTGESPPQGQQQQGGNSQDDQGMNTLPVPGQTSSALPGQQQQQQQQQSKKTMTKWDAQGNITHTADNDHSTTAQNNINRTANKNITDEAANTGVYEAKQTLHLDAPTINTWVDNGGGGPYNPGL